jgi:hypothetical protein
LVKELSQTRQMLLAPLHHRSMGILRTACRYKSALAARRVWVAAVPRNTRPESVFVGSDAGTPRVDVDAIIVLGGGLWESKEIPPWAERRLDGAALLRAAHPPGPSILICGGGSPHGLPVLDESTGQVVHEGTAYAEYLMDRWDVPASCILKESSSYDTIGNGYFSAMIHAVPAGWKRVAVVTSDFHMPRSRAIFEKVYGLVEGSLGVCIELEFVSVTDDGIIEEKVREVRVEKEAQSVATWRKNMVRSWLVHLCARRSSWFSGPVTHSLAPLQAAIDNLAEFHNWLHSTHTCYAVERQHLFGLNPDSSGSY